MISLPLLVSLLLWWAAFCSSQRLCVALIKLLIMLSVVACDHLAGLSLALVSGRAQMMEQQQQQECVEEVYLLLLPPILLAKPRVYDEETVRLVLVVPPGCRETQNRQKKFKWRQLTGCQLDNQR